MADAQTDSKKLAHVVKQLSHWRFLAGATKVSADDLKVDAIYFVSTFVDVTSEELDLLIAMFGNRTLVVTDMNYVNFSPVFMAQVVEAYKDFKRRALAPVVSRIKELPPAPVNPTPAQNAEAMVWMMKEVWQIIEQNNNPMMARALVNRVYEYVLEQKFMTVPKTMVTAARKYAADILKTLQPSPEAKNKDSIGAKLLYSQSDEYKEALQKTLCRVYCLREFMRKQGIERVVSWVSEAHFKKGKEHKA